MFNLPPASHITVSGKSNRILAQSSRVRCHTQANTSVVSRNEVSNFCLLETYLALGKAHCKTLQARYCFWLAAGVDNGQIWFDHARVPRDALLDAYGSVDEQGTYHSKIPSVAARFGVTVGGLTTGVSIRLSVNQHKSWIIMFHVLSRLS